MKKEDKAFKDDAELDGACKSFIVDRLKFEDELEWPLLRDISDPAPPSSSSTSTSDEEPHKERMAVFMKLTGDEVFSNSLEVKCPRNYKGLGISMSSFRPKPLSKEAIKKKEAAAAAAASTAVVITSSIDESKVMSIGKNDTNDNALNSGQGEIDISSDPDDGTGKESTDISARTSDPSDKKVANIPTPTPKTQKTAATATSNTSPNKKVAAGSGASAVKAVKGKK